MNRLFAAACVTLFSLSLASVVLADGVPKYGIVVGGENNPSAASAVASLGAGAVRMDLFWYQAQPAPNGPITYPDVSMFGNRTILLSISRMPSWALNCTHGAPYSPCLPDGNAWSAFIANVTRNYENQPNVVLGIWNEPSLSDSYGGGNWNPYSYAWVFNVASLARDSVNPNVRLAGPESANASGGWFDQTMPQILPYMHSRDVVTLHWYFDGPAINGYMDDAINQAGGHEVWLSEVGYATCDDADQAYHLDLFMNYFAAYAGSQWDTVFWYVLHNGSNCDYGILHTDYSPRAAFNHYYTYWIAPELGNGNYSPTLASGQTLYVNQPVYSPSSTYQLFYQSDGNLVVYRVSDGTPVWASGTVGTSVGDVPMQTDGNFVIYDGSGTPVWNTGTFNNPGAFLVLTDDGHLLIVAADGSTILWQT